MFMKSVRIGSNDVSHHLFNLSDTYANSVDPNDTAYNEMRLSRLIKIYTICHSGFYSRLIFLLASMDMSKSKNGIVHFRNPGLKYRN